jgi:glycosyltransferase involved in cell wall biosynthesis
MSGSTSTHKAESRLMPFRLEGAGKESEKERPLVSLVVPAHNEGSIAARHLSILCQYMESLEDEYRWEMTIVNDGSSDGTGELVDIFARSRGNVRVVHHVNNRGVGEAFKSAFELCQGDYIVTLDLDLSYSPDHIEKLLTRIRESGAHVVVASPYMKEGMVSNVPWLRRVLSVCANRFLARTVPGAKISTLTSMVRAYDGKFLRSLNLRSVGMEINPEVIYKTMLLRARTEEIPAHLDWSQQKADGIDRRSSMRVLRHTLAVLLSGFLFRPVVFFIVPGLTLLLFALYVNSWMVIHFIEAYHKSPQYSWFFSRASVAVGAAYTEFPHTFIVGLLTDMLAIQLLSLGILALQSKSYFEEVFHLGSSIYRRVRENKDIGVSSEMQQI